jgi:soluble lytic murein transglycosylase-like protein
MPDKDSLIATTKMIADKYGIEGALACAIVEQESDWNPWAIRYEPAFFTHYIQPMMDTHHIGPQEANARSTSWGLMQLMGEVAREYGFGGPFLSELCDPETGLDMGCKYFSALMGEVGNDVDKALLRWNGGGNVAYGDQVKARIPTYQ